MQNKRSINASFKTHANILLKKWLTINSTHQTWESDLVIICLLWPSVLRTVLQILPLKNGTLILFVYESTIKIPKLIMLWIFSYLPFLNFYYLYKNGKLPILLLPITFVKLLLCCQVSTWNQCSYPSHKEEWRVCLGLSPPALLFSFSIQTFLMLKQPFC